MRRELILCLNLTFGYTTFADEAREVLRRLGRMRERLLCLNLTFTFADEAREDGRRLGRVRERREVAALAEY